MPEGPGTPGAPGGGTPSGPVNPVKSYGSPMGNMGGATPSSPSTTPSFDFSKPSKEAQDAIKGFQGVGSDLNKMAETLSKVLKALGESTEDANKGFKEIRGTLSDMVDDLDDSAKTMKNLTTLNTQLSKAGLFDKRSRKQMLDDVTNIEKKTKKAMENTSNPKAIRALKELNTTYGKIKKTIEESQEVNEKLWDEVTEMSSKAARNSAKAAGEMKDAWTKSAKGIRKELFDMGKGVMADFKKYDKHGLFGNLMTIGKGLRLGMLNAGLGAKNMADKGIVAGRKADQAFRQQHLQDNWKAIGSAGKLKSGGVQALQMAKILGEHKASPAFRSEFLKKTKQAEQAPDNQKTPKGELTDYKESKGRNRWLQKLMGQAAANPGGPGFLANQAAAGGGSAIKGIAGGGLTQILNLAETGGNLLGKLGGGMGAMGTGIGSIAGKAMPWVAVAKAAMDIWDKTAEINKAVEVPGAKGGAFAGPGSVQSGYKGMRALVGSTGDEISLGLTWEKNTELMKKMVEGGMTIGSEHLKNAANGASSIPGMGDNYLKTLMDQFKESGTGTSMGAAWHGSTRGARGIGLSQEEGMELSIKLMQKYQQSAGETVSFYTKVEKGAKAAGMSTTKYISVVEGLSDKFVGFGNALGNTEHMLSELSKSGKFTGDQLKDMVEYLGKGKDLSLEQKAFALQMGGKDAMGNMSKGQQTELDTAAKEFKDMVDGLQSDEGVKLKASLGKNNDLSTDDLQGIEAKLGMSGVDENDKKTLQGLIDRARNSKGLRDTFDKGSPVGAAVGMDALGENLPAAALTRLYSTKALLKASHVDFGKFAENPGSALAGNPAAAMIMASMGGKDTMNQLPHVMSAGAQALATTDLSGDSTTRERLAQDLNARGLVDKDKKAYTADSIMTDDKKNLATNYAKMPETLVELLNSNVAVKVAMDKNTKMNQAAAQEAKTRAMESETKTSADVFARSFEYLFFELLKPLGAIRDIITEWFGDQASKGVKKANDEYSKTWTPAVTESVLKHVDSKLEETDKKLKEAQASGDKEAVRKLQAEKADWTDRKASIQGAVSGGVPVSVMNKNEETARMTGTVGAMGIRRNVKNGEIIDHLDPVPDPGPNTLDGKVPAAGDKSKWDKVLEMASDGGADKVARLSHTITQSMMAAGKYTHGVDFGPEGASQEVDYGTVPKDILLKMQQAGYGDFAENADKKGGVINYHHNITNKQYVATANQAFNPNDESRETKKAGETSTPASTDTSVVKQK